MRNYTKKLIILLSAMMLFTVAGCQSTEILYQGKHVDPQFAIPLNDDAIEAEWRTFELAIGYVYKKYRLNLHIEGQINLTDQYAEIYHYLDRLDVYLLFLDSNLTVIKVEKLANSFTSSPKDSIPFKGKYQAPNQTSSFSFAYYGTVREMDRKDGNTATLFHVPK